MQNLHSLLLSCFIFFYRFSPIFIVFTVFYHFWLFFTIVHNFNHFSPFLPLCRHFSQFSTDFHNFSSFFTVFTVLSSISRTYLELRSSYNLNAINSSGSWPPNDKLEQGGNQRVYGGNTQVKAFQMHWHINIFQNISKCSDIYEHILYSFVKWTGH